MCRNCLVLCLLLIASSFAHAQTAPQPRFTKATDGGWDVAGTGYTAAVNGDGYLSSLKVGAVETVGVAFTYQPNAKLAADRAEAVDDTLKVHLKGNGEATIDYQFRSDGLTITPTWKAAGYGEFRFNASPSLLGIELLNDKSVTVGGDATHFVERGEVRGVPAVPSSRNQMVRLHYPGFSLHVYVQAWGAPFNYESAGSIQGLSWGRPLLEGNKPFPIVFTIQRDAARATLTAPVFVPRTDKVASLYYPAEPCTWNLDLGERKAYQYLLDAGINRLNLSWRLTDFHDKEAGTGQAALTLDATTNKTVQPVTIKTPGTGYYQVLFTLSEPSGKMLPSSFLTRFTVIHNVPGMVNRDDTLAGKGISDYAVVGMIGIGGIRESHNVGEFFTNQPVNQNETEWMPVAGADGVSMNIKRLDDLFNTATAEGGKYHLTWFFQANSRPQYATPAIYEAMAYALVSRYKDRNKIWEVENEPNFGYTPENYLNQCVIPFATGAKRADPTCSIIGPGCVSLSHTLRFMDTIYTMGAGKWFDQISTHTYPGPGESWEQFGNLSMLRELHEWMHQHGDDNKPLWQTEQGYAWDNAPKGQCARYAVRQFLQGWRNGIEPWHQYYFYPHSHGFESWYQAGGGEQGSAESWTPIAAAQRFLAESTYGMKYVGDIPSPYKGIYLARFSGATEDVVAAWTMDFAYILPLKAPGLKHIVGFMGDDRQPTSLRVTTAGFVGQLAEPTMSQLVLSLSSEPVYYHIAKGSAFEILGAPFGRNLAAVGAGAVATASSETPSNPASFANDGNWEQWEDVIGFKGRTAWKSGQKDPSPENPDWQQVTFPMPRTINRMAALCYLPAVSPSPRDWQFQVDVNGQWKTVASAKDDWSWSIVRQFPSVSTSKIRMVVTRLNDGWHGDRRWMPILMGPKATNYTESKLLISELEAYGVPLPVQITASAATPNHTAAFKNETLTVRVENRSPLALNGTLQVKAPRGWTTQPTRIPVTAAGNQDSAPMTVQLTAPDTIPVGTVPIDLTLRGATGPPLDMTRVSIQVVSPVELTPQAPSAINPQEQPLSVAVKNVTDAPLSGVVVLAAGASRLPEQPFGPLAPKASATVEFKVPNLKLAGAPVKVTYSARANGLLATATQDFNVRGWQVLGPYPNEGGTAGFDKVYDPETTIDLDKAYAVLGAQTARWKPALDQPNGFVDLAPLFQPNNNVVAYATIYVKSPAARKAIVSVGSDDGIKAWLNGKVVVADNASRGAAPGQDEAPVDLKKGWNQVLLKITQGGYGWGFYFDLLDAKHKPLTDITYASLGAG